MKKKINLFLFVALLMTILPFTGCEDSVKITSLSNTYWENNYDQYTYVHIWFYNDNSAKVSILTEKSNEPTISSCNWTCTNAGYVSISLVYGSYTKEWITGHFRDGKLELEDMIFTYKGTATSH